MPISISLPHPAIPMDFYTKPLSLLCSSFLPTTTTNLLPSPLLSKFNLPITPKTKNPPLLPKRAVISNTTTNQPSSPCQPSSQQYPTIHKWRTNAAPASASAADIEMARNKDGVWAPKQSKVVVLWDLDNKPPKGPPYQAAMALRQIAQQFGDVIDMSAYANRHAFIHLPQWVAEDRRERRGLDILERKGLAISPTPYLCAVCGRKCKTNQELKKHFKQLHERERQKKISRMRSLKGKKRQRYKERFITGNHKYEEAARVLMTPKVGYGLASELRRAGVFVKTVQDRPQAADSALKRQMQHSITRGIDCLFLVSDDSDFSEMLRRARESNLQTVVVGDERRALSRNADYWVSWIGVENGEVGEEFLRKNLGFSGRGGMEEEEEVWEGSLFSDFEDEEDDIVNEIAITSKSLDSGFNIRISAFSEDDLYWDSEEEDEGF